MCTGQWAVWQGHYVRRETKLGRRPTSVYCRLYLSSRWGFLCLQWAVVGSWHQHLQLVQGMMDWALIDQVHPMPPKRCEIPPNCWWLSYRPPLNRKVGWWLKGGRQLAAHWPQYLDLIEPSPLFLKLVEDVDAKTRRHLLADREHLYHRFLLKGTVPAPKRSSNLLKRLRKIFAMPVRPRSVTEIRYNIIFPP